MNRRRILVGACLVVSAACGRSPDKPSVPNATTPRGAPPASLIRLARAGGRARAYSVPSLSQADWQTDVSVPAIDTLVGTDFEQHLVIAIDRKKNVVALDLDSRRVRTYLSQVRLAALGPDASVYAVDTGGAVTQLSRRSSTHFGGRVPPSAGPLFATAGGELMAIDTRSNRLGLIGNDGARWSALPRGPVSSTFWGDLVAVATDSGVVLLDPQGKRPAHTIPRVGEAQATLFSPSGHRLYSVGTDRELIVIDRFGREILKRIALPGPARALRGDFFGNWLLVRPAHGDSVWVVDLNAGKVAGGVAAAWSADLPMIAGAHSLIVRRSTDIVAVDLGSAAMKETGRVAGGGADLWVSVLWAPDSPKATPPAEATADTARVAPPAAATDSVHAGADSAAAGSVLYLQISSSRNPTWAADLAAKLRAAGLQPSVLKPVAAEESYRVVLGPFRSREAAEEVGRKVGMPSFVITAQGDSGR